MKRTQIIMPLLVLASAISIISGITIGLPPSDAGIIKITESEFTSAIPDAPIAIKKGESKIIPVSIVGNKEQSINVNTGVTMDGYESLLSFTDEQKMPDGISVTLNKRSLNLPATTEKGFEERDIVNLTINVSSDTKSGDYPLTFVLYTKNVDGSTDQVREYFTVHVE